MDGKAVQTDPGLIARRLGVTEELVRHLQARGVLRSFGLGEAEVRQRLHDAHLRQLSSETDLQQLERR
jgi:transposase